jgi:4-amino-4-deoxy-L-arabinose transferase-like glycosyltransferase
MAKTRRRPTTPAHRAPARAPADAAPPSDRTLLACLGIALLALALALVVTLSHAAQRRTNTNGVVSRGAIATLAAGASFCQLDELVPAGTAAIRADALAEVGGGPKLAVMVRRRGAVLARTTVAPGWRSGTIVARIEPPRTDLEGVEVCFRIAGAGLVGPMGAPSGAGTGKLRIDGDTGASSLAMTYLRTGRDSWWSSASDVATRLGRGRSTLTGGWVAWLIGALVAGAAALAAWLVLRAVRAPEPPPGDDAAPAGRRVPRAAWIVALVATLNAAAWSLITPVFQVPDEDTHIAYVQQVGETGRPPVDEPRAAYSPELRTALVVAGFGAADRQTYRSAVWSGGEQRRIDRALGVTRPRHGNDDAGPSSPEPPLFYAIEAIPYRLGAGATLLDRIALMRLTSALMAGVTALLVFLFVRECLPRRPWAWTVGALVSAFVPIFGSTSGGVNPDALLFPLSAALLLCLAFAFRRGLSPRLAAWTGAVLALGVVGKINFYGLVPGALVAIALAARNARGAWDREVARLVGAAVAIPLGTYAAMTLLDAAVWDRPFILAGTPASAPAQHGDLLGQLGYLWQIYFPRLPGQAPAYPEYSPPYDGLFQSFVGKFGWLSVAFPPWAYELAAVAFLAVGALAARAIWRERHELRRRRSELVGYLSIAGGLLLLIGLVALRGWAPGIGGALQGRYLLPLLGLFGAVVALAARGAGEHWGRLVGIVLVVAAIAWSLFAQLVTIAYFYG